MTRSRTQHATVTRSQVATALKYLTRVPARGHEEEQELYSLIQALLNTLNGSKSVYTKDGSNAA